MTISESKLIDLETKIAYQEDTIQTLNEVVCRQQQQIDHLETTFNTLFQRFQTLSDTVEQITPDDTPPHY
jgi:SlyX protein